MTLFTTDLVRNINELTAVGIINAKQLAQKLNEQGSLLHCGGY